MLSILRGDDTNFKDLRVISITLTEMSFSVLGCKADFTLCGQRVEIPQFAVGVPIRIDFTAEQTRKMELGVQCGVFRIIDDQDRVRTIDATIRVRVTDIPQEVYGNNNEVAISVKLSWNNLTNLPLENCVFDLSDTNGQVAALGALIESLGGTFHA